MKMKFKINKPYEYKRLKDFSKKHHLKSSKKRLSIIECFINQNKHVSAEELYNKMKKAYPGIGYSTVYRTLKLLVECGLASACNFEQGITKFESAYEKEHHDHMICTKCGAIIEFTNKEIERMQRNVARKYKFLFHNHKLEIYGLCLKCANKGME
ncbi:MAG: transcriptional repressor [candidate division WOR-3 bacterium]